MDFEVWLHGPPYLDSMRYLYDAGYLISCGDGCDRLQAFVFLIRWWFMLYNKSCFGGDNLKSTHQTGAALEVLPNA